MKRVIAEEETRDAAASWLDRHEKSPSTIVRWEIDRQEAVKGKTLSIRYIEGKLLIISHEEQNTAICYRTE